MLYEKPSLEGVLVMDRKKLGYGVLVSCLGENLTLTGRSSTKRLPFIQKSDLAIT